MKDIYIVVHVRIWLWDLDYTSKQHTKIYAQTVQGLADYAQKFMHFQAW